MYHLIKDGDLIFPPQIQISIEAKDFITKVKEY